MAEAGEFKFLSGRQAAEALGRIADAIKQLPTDQAYVSYLIMEQMASHALREGTRKMSRAQLRKDRASVRKTVEAQHREYPELNYSDEVL